MMIPRRMSRNKLVPTVAIVNIGLGEDVSVESFTASNLDIFPRLYESAIILELVGYPPKKPKSAIAPPFSIRYSLLVIAFMNRGDLDQKLHSPSSATKKKNGNKTGNTCVNTIPRPSLDDAMNKSTDENDTPISVIANTDIIQWVLDILYSINLKACKCPDNLV